MFYDSVSVQSGVFLLLDLSYRFLLLLLFPSWVWLLKEFCSLLALRYSSLAPFGMRSCTLSLEDTGWDEKYWSRMVGKNLASFSCLLVARLDIWFSVPIPFIVPCGYLSCPVVNTTMKCFVDIWWTYYIVRKKRPPGSITLFAVFFLTSMCNPYCFLSVRTKFSFKQLFWNTSVI